MYTSKVEGSDFLENNYKTSNKNKEKISSESMERYLQGNISRILH
jgi:hypothetical protein